METQSQLQATTRQGSLAPVPEERLPPQSRLPSLERDLHQQETILPQRSSATMPIPAIEEQAPETSLFFVGIVSAFIIEGAAVMGILYLCSLFG